MKPTQIGNDAIVAPKRPSEGERMRDVVMAIHAARQAVEEMQRTTSQDGRDVLNADLLWCLQHLNRVYWTLKNRVESGSFRRV
jgi:hypothetical protein